MAHNDPNTAGGPTAQQLEEISRSAAEADVAVSRMSREDKAGLEAAAHSQKGLLRATSTVGV